MIHRRRAMRMITMIMRMFWAAFSWAMSEFSLFWIGGGLICLRFLGCVGGLSFLGCVVELSLVGVVELSLFYMAGLLFFFITGSFSIRTFVFYSIFLFSANSCISSAISKAAYNEPVNFAFVNVLSFFNPSIAFLTIKSASIYPY